MSTSGSQDDLRPDSHGLPLLAARVAWVVVALVALVIVDAFERGIPRKDVVETFCISLTIRKARTLEALFAVTARALGAVSEEDARGFFEACGYGTFRDH